MRLGDYKAAGWTQLAGHSDSVPCTVPGLTDSHGDETTLPVSFLYGPSVPPEVSGLLGISRGKESNAMGRSVFGQLPIMFPMKCGRTIGRKPASHPPIHPSVFSRPGVSSREVRSLMHDRVLVRDEGGLRFTIVPLWTQAHIKSGP